MVGQLHNFKTVKLKHSCLICTLPFGADSGLCPYCAEKLFARREPSRRDDRDLVARSLFAWRKDGTPAFRELVRRLKGKEDPEPWTQLALWMIEAQRPNLRQPKLLVPVPSRAANHALGWARALSSWTGWPVREELEKPSSSPEIKKLSRQERQGLRFTRKSGVSCTKYTEVIIVDDIITTGATAVAAHHALGRPRNCEVWCLMDRRPWQ